MENNKQKSKDFRITQRLFLAYGTVLGLLADIAYAASLSNERKTSDRLRASSIKALKRSLANKVYGKYI